VEEDLFRREADWAIRRLRSAKTLYYRATIIRDTGDRRFADTPDFPPKPVLEEPFASALNDLIEEVRAKSADIESFAAELLDRLLDDAPDRRRAVPVRRGWSSTVRLAGSCRWRPHTALVQNRPRKMWKRPDQDAAGRATGTSGCRSIRRPVTGKPIISDLAPRR
jgi:hypothetical protein